jgi:predicted dehydrogenase
MKISRIGLIGLGKHGQRYVHHIRHDFPELTLSAICRKDPVRLSRDVDATGAAGFVDHAEMLRSGLCDAVVAVVPPHLNLDIVSLCREREIPLLLEKPAAANLDDARRMRAVTGDGKVPVMVAQTLRYNGAVRAIRSRLDEIGPITSISMTQRFEPSALAWLDDPGQSGAGVVLHTGVHCFDLIHHLTGLRARRVAAQVARLKTRRTEDCCAAALELEGGVLATVSLARTTRGRTGHIEIAGEEATLAGDHVLNRAHVVRGRDASELDCGETVPTVRDILADFIGSLVNETPMPIPLQCGLDAVAVACACLESARRAEAVAVEYVG